WVGDRGGAPGRQCASGSGGRKCRRRGDGRKCGYGGGRFPGIRSAVGSWRLGPVKRGREIHDQLTDGSLGPYFPTIDMIPNGNATSLKSIDLEAATYQNSNRLTSRINAYVDKLSEFSGAEWGQDVVKPADILDRTLNLVVPKGSMTTMQRSVVDSARIRGQTLTRPVKIIVTEF